MATTTTTSQNPLWDLQAQYLPETFRQAEDIYFRGDVGPYTGPRVAGYDPVRAQGANLGVQAAFGPQQQLADAYSSGILGYAGGTAPAQQRLATQAATAASAPFGSTFGGARHARAANQAAADSIARNQLTALGQIPSAQQAAFTPAQTLSQIGQGQQQYQQQLIDADRQLYDEQRNLPYNWLAQYQQALGFPGSVTPSTTSTSQQKASGFEKALGIGSLLLGGGGLFGF